MSRSKYKALLGPELTGQEPDVAKEVRDKGLLRMVNQTLRSFDYVLQFYYRPADDPEQVGPYEVKLERIRREPMEFEQPTATPEPQPDCNT